MRDEWRQWRTAILTQVLLLTIAAILPHFDKGYWTVGHWGPKALSLQAGSHFGIPLSTEFDPPGHLLILFSIVHLLPQFFRLFTQMHLSIDSSVEGQYITGGETL